MWWFLRLRISNELFKKTIGSHVSQWYDKGFKIGVHTRVKFVINILKIKSEMQKIKLSIDTDLHHKNLQQRLMQNMYGRKMQLTLKNFS